MARKVFLTKRVEFSASHKYYNKNFSLKENRKHFGEISPYGHGHNYLLEVTVTGTIDKNTGMIINTYFLKDIINQVLKEFDHKFLNEDTPYFKNTQPTTENLAKVLGKKLKENLPKTCLLYKIKLFETNDLFVEYYEKNG